MRRPLKRIEHLLLFALGWVVSCGSSGKSGAPDAGPPGGKGGGSPNPNASQCEAFIACIGAVQPQALDTTVAAYGPDGSCRMGFSEAECEAQCLTAELGLHKIYRDVEACNVCRSDDDCFAATGGLCDLELHRCFECRDNFDCGENLRGRVCIAETRTCAQCASDTDCGSRQTSLAPVCDPASHTCRECLGDTDCTNRGDRHFCFVPAQRCVDCLEDDDCGPKHPNCMKNVSGRECVGGCISDAECARFPGLHCVKYYGCEECAEDAHCSGNPHGPYCLDYQMLDSRSAYCGMCREDSWDCSGNSRGRLCLRSDEQPSETGGGAPYRFVCGCNSDFDCLTGWTCNTTAHLCVQ